MLRSVQDLLTERRYCVQEQRGESDKTARGVLQFRIDEIDREVAMLTGKTVNS